MCQLNSFIGLERLLKNGRPKSVMPAKAGNQTFNPRTKSQNLDSGLSRNNARKNRVSVLTIRAKPSATLLFLLVFGLTLARAEFGAAQNLEKVRIGMPSLSLSFIAPQVAYARGFFREEGIDAEIIRIATNIGIVAVTTKEIGYTTAVAPACVARSKGCRSKWLSISTAGRSMC